MAAPNDLFKETLNLTPKQKVELIDKMLSSLDTPDKEIDKLWAQEAENRISAFEHEKIKAVTLKEVLEKYR